MKKVKIYPLKSPVDVEVEIPGSKSYTNRALIMAAMTKGAVKIIKPLFSDDTEAMIGCLKTLGIEIEISENWVKVIGDTSNIKDKEYSLNARLSGTTIRFIIALACVVPGIKKIYGDAGLNKRPIAELVEGLRKMGAEIEYDGVEGNPPITVKSSKLITGKTSLNGDVSSQYFSALLMIAPLIGFDLDIEVIGNQISKPYIDMTVDTMQKFGVTAENRNNYQNYFVKAGQKYEIQKFTIEGDFSAAGYFAGIAALTKSKITMTNLNIDTAQGDIHLIKILETMGNKVEYEVDRLIVQGMGVKPVRVDMEMCPDQAQTLAVISAFADGLTEMTGIRSLRLKETERVIALVNELKKMGIETEDNLDDLKVYGGKPISEAIDTYGDHRMAMSFAQAGTILEDGIIINDPDVVNKTFPEFWEKLREIGVKIEFIDDVASS